MNFLIVTSTEDIASMNIRKNLIESTIYNFQETDLVWQEHTLFRLEEITSETKHDSFFQHNQVYLGLTDLPLIFLNELKIEPNTINPDFLIFASRHRSETARPSFLVHSTGNWSNKAEFGGNPHELSRTSAILLKSGYYSLKNQIKIPEFSEFSNYHLDIEVTHHGPTTIKKPLIFIELGSSEQEWKVEKAGKLVGQAIIETCLNYSKHEGTSNIGIGFGGTHYAPQFKNLTEKNKTAVSFICPKYFIQELTKDTIKQMIRNTTEKVTCFIIDWKGTNSQDKQHLLPLLNEFDLPISKTKDIK